MKLWVIGIAGAGVLAGVLMFTPANALFRSAPPQVPLDEARAQLAAASRGAPGAVLCNAETAVAYRDAARAYAFAMKRDHQAWPDLFNLTSRPGADEQMMIAPQLSGVLRPGDLPDHYNWEDLRNLENTAVLATTPSQARHACPEMVEYWGEVGMHTLARLRFQRARARLPEGDSQRNALFSRSFEEQTRRYERIRRRERELVAKLDEIRLNRD